MDIDVTRWLSTPSLEEIPLMSFEKALQCVREPGDFQVYQTSGGEFRVCLKDIKEKIIDRFIRKSGAFFSYNDKDSGISLEVVTIEEIIEKLKEYQESLKKQNQDKKQAPHQKEKKQAEASAAQDAFSLLKDIRRISQKDAEGILIKHGIGFYLIRDSLTHKGLACSMRTADMENGEPRIIHFPIKKKSGRYKAVFYIEHPAQEVSLEGSGKDIKKGLNEICLKIRKVANLAAYNPEGPS